MHVHSARVLAFRDPRAQRVARQLISARAMRNVRVALGVLLLTGCSTVEMELVTLPGGQIHGNLPAPPVEAEPPRTVALVPAKISIDDTIRFETWSADLLHESHAVLDEVAQVLLENPKIGRVEIQGHTARTGQPKRSLKLSMDRASAVLEYLVSKGVAKDRLEAKGYGETQPVADNTTKEGRDKNRRVEFVIVNERAEQVALVQDAQPTDDEEE
jgi:outer membrane protein OmpA-like peptidoglycan-associated protein